MKVSLLIPVFNEAEQLPETVHVLEKTLSEADISDYELFFVDDGSRDETWAVLQAQAQRNPALKGLRFSRNFGKEKALMAGLNKVSGDVVITLDADLQHPPRYIPQMIDLYSQGFDVVEGVKTDRGEESKLSRLLANSFYRLFRWCSNLNLLNASDYKLMSRPVVEALKNCDESEPFFRSLSAWVGFKRVTFPFEVEPRHHGTSKWKLSSLLKLSQNAFTGFSTTPLLLPGLVGLSLMGFVFVCCLVRLVRVLFGASWFTPFQGLALLMTVLTALTLMALSLLGLYLGATLSAVRRRPAYIISEEIV